MLRGAGGAALSGRTPNGYGITKLRQRPLQDRLHAPGLTGLTPGGYGLEQLRRRPPTQS